MFAEWDGRLYFYTGAKIKEKVAHMVVRPAREIPRVVLKTDPKRKPCEIKIPRALGQTFEEDPGLLPPGEYITIISAMAQTSGTYKRSVYICCSPA